MPASKATKKTRLTGTGTDPLGRYPKGQDYAPESADDPTIAQAIEKGWIEETAVPETPKPTFDVHTPVEDDTGALRTDRPFAPEEAAAVDAFNRADQIQRRVTRFLRKGGR